MAPVAVECRRHADEVDRQQAPLVAQRAMVHHGARNHAVPAANMARVLVRFLILAQSTVAYSLTAFEQITGKLSFLSFSLAELEVFSFPSSSTEFSAA